MSGAGPAYNHQMGPAPGSHQSVDPAQYMAAPGAKQVGQPVQLLPPFKSYEAAAYVSVHPGGQQLMQQQQQQHMKGVLPGGMPPPHQVLHTIPGHMLHPMMGYTAPPPQQSHHVPMSQQPPHQRQGIPPKGRLGHLQPQSSGSVHSSGSAAATSQQLGQQRLAKRIYPPGYRPDVLRLRILAHAAYTNNSSSHPRHAASRGEPSYRGPMGGAASESSQAVAAADEQATSQQQHELVVCARRLAACYLAGCFRGPLGPHSLQGNLLASMLARNAPAAWNALLSMLGTANVPAGSAQSGAGASADSSLLSPSSVTGGSSGPAADESHHAYGGSSAESAATHEDLGGAEDDYHYDHEQDYLEEVGEEHQREEEEVEHHDNTLGESHIRQHDEATPAAPGADSQQAGSSTAGAEEADHASGTPSHAKQLSGRQLQTHLSTSSNANNKKNGGGPSQYLREQQALWLLHDNCLQVTVREGRIVVKMDPVQLETMATAAVVAVMPLPPWYQMPVPCTAGHTAALPATGTPLLPVAQPPGPTAAHAPGLAAPMQPLPSMSSAPPLITPYTPAAHTQVPATPPAPGMPVLPGPPGMMVAPSPVQHMAQPVMMQQVPTHALVNMMPGHPPATTAAPLPVQQWPPGISLPGQIPPQHHTAAMPPAHAPVSAAQQHQQQAAVVAAMHAQQRTAASAAAATAEEARTLHHHHHQQPVAPARLLENDMSGGLQQEQQQHHNQRQQQHHHLQQQQQTQQHTAAAPAPPSSSGVTLEAVCVHLADLAFPGNSRAAILRRIAVAELAAEAPFGTGSKPLHTLRMPAIDLAPRLRALAPAEWVALGDDIKGTGLSRFTYLFQHNHNRGSETAVEHCFSVEGPDNATMVVVLDLGRLQEAAAAMAPPGAVLPSIDAALAAAAAAAASSAPAGSKSSGSAAAGKQDAPATRAEPCGTLQQQQQQQQRESTHSSSSAGGIATAAANNMKHSSSGSLSRSGSNLPYAVPVVLNAQGQSEVLVGVQPAATPLLSGSTSSGSAPGVAPQAAHPAPGPDHGASYHAATHQPSLNNNSSGNGAAAVKLPRSLSSTSSMISYVAGEHHQQHHHQQQGVAAGGPGSQQPPAPRSPAPLGMQHRQQQQHPAVPAVPVARSAAAGPSSSGAPSIQAGPPEQRHQYHQPHSDQHMAAAPSGGHTGHTPQHRGVSHHTPTAGLTAPVAPPMRHQAAPLDTLALCTACVAVFWPHSWPLLSASIAIVCQPAWTTQANGGPCRATAAFAAREVASCQTRQGAPQPPLPGMRPPPPLQIITADPLFEFSPGPGVSAPPAGAGTAGSQQQDDGLGHGGERGPRELTGTVRLKVQELAAAVVDAVDRTPGSSRPHPVSWPPGFKGLHVPALHKLAHPVMSELLGTLSLGGPAADQLLSMCLVRLRELARSGVTAGAHVAGAGQGHGHIMGGSGPGPRGPSSSSGGGGGGGGGGGMMAGGGYSQGGGGRPYSSSSGGGGGHHSSGASREPVENGRAGAGAQYPAHQGSLPHPHQHPHQHPHGRYTPSHPQHYNHEPRQYAPRFFGAGQSEVPHQQYPGYGTGRRSGDGRPPPAGSVNFGHTGHTSSRDGSAVQSYPARAVQGSHNGLAGEGSGGGRESEAVLQQMRALPNSSWADMDDGEDGAAAGAVPSASTGGGPQSGAHTVIAPGAGSQSIASPAGVPVTTPRAQPSDHAHQAPSTAPAAQPVTGHAGHHHGGAVHHHHHHHEDEEEEGYWSAEDESDTYLPPSHE